MFFSICYTDLICYPAKAAESDIEVISFDVPEDLRVHEMSVFTASIKNNGSSTVKNLQFRFIDGDWFFNLSPIFELPAGQIFNYSGHGWINGEVGSIHTYELSISDKHLSVSRVLLPTSIAYVEIQGFNITPHLVRVSPEGGTGLFIFNYTLRNSGNDSGLVYVNVCSGPTHPIFKETISIDGQSWYNQTGNATVSCGRIHIQRQLDFYLIITGDSVGPHNRTLVSAYFYTSENRDSIETTVQPIIMIAVIVIILCCMVIIAQHLRKRH